VPDVIGPGCYYVKFALCAFFSDHSIMLQLLPAVFEVFHTSLMVLMQLLDTFDSRIKIHTLFLDCAVHVSLLYNSPIPLQLT